MNLLRDRISSWRTRTVTGGKCFVPAGIFALYRLDGHHVGKLVPAVAAERHLRPEQTRRQIGRVEGSVGDGNRDRTRWTTARPHGQQSVNQSINQSINLLLYASSKVGLHSHRQIVKKITHIVNCLKNNK